MKVYRLLFPDQTVYVGIMLNSSPLSRNLAKLVSDSKTQDSAIAKKIREFGIEKATSVVSKTLPKNKAVKLAEQLIEDAGLKSLNKFKTVIPPDEMSQATKKKISKANSGELSWLYNKKSGDHPRAKKVVSFYRHKQYPIKDVRVWDSVTDASKELNIHQSNISMVLKGKARTAGGFFWAEYENFKHFHPEIKLEEENAENI